MSSIQSLFETKLSNGLPVILQPMEGAVASIYWWVNVGSADENSSESGYAHFLEHMLFKDATAKETGKPSTGKLAQSIEALGGEINAFTSFDQTVYHVSCAEQHWEKVFRTFGKMTLTYQFSREDVEREREVILEELRKNEDSPDRRLFQAFFEKAYSHHPYGQPVIGSKKSIQAATPTKLARFFRRTYIPANMGLVLVGPLKDFKGARKRRLLRIAEQYYGSEVFPARSGRKSTRPSERMIASNPRVAVSGFDVQLPTGIFGFRVPAIEHEAIPGLDLLAGILGFGETARLYQRLFYRDALVTDVTAGAFVPKDPGLFYLHFEASQTSDIPTILEAIGEEINRLKQEGPTSEEFEKVVANVESERLYSTQTADGLAHRLGFLKFSLGNLNFDRDYVTRLNEFSRDYLIHLACRYFDARRLAASFLVPRAEQKNLKSKELVEKFKYLFRPSHSVFPKKGHLKSTKQGAVTLLRGDSGLQAVLFQRPQSPVFSLQAFAWGGLRYEWLDPVEDHHRDWGASYLLGQSWPKGTQTRDAYRIAQEIERHAASFHGFSGKNSVGLDLLGLARNWDVLSELFVDTLVDPIFPPDEVEHSKRVAQDSIRAMEEHSQQLCIQYFLENLFDHHPYGRRIYGSFESLDTLTPEKLKAFHQKWIRPQNLVLALSGNVSAQKMEKLVSEIEQNMRSFSAKGVSDTGENKNQKRYPIPVKPLAAPRVVERSLGREQLHLLYGGLGTSYRSQDRYALRLLQTLLAGQSGRLFLELREKRSLAYAVAPVGFEGIERGIIAIYAACSPDKKDTVLATIQGILEKLASKGPSERELNRAKEFYIGQQAMELQGDQALAAYYGLQKLYRLPLNEEAKIRKNLEAITPEVIQKICYRYFIKPHLVTSMVG